jgi:Flp pilus assembly protein TadB
MEESELIKEVRIDMEQAAAGRARDRARNARWDLNIAIFLFAVLILVIILATYTNVGIEVVAPVALFGLAMVWVVGWRRERQLFQRFYNEELLRLERDIKRAVTGKGKTSIEETLEDKVQKALRERFK